MGRRQEVTFVAADGLESTAMVEMSLQPQGGWRFPAWQERHIRDRVPVMAFARPPAVADRVYTRRYELEPYREPDGRESWRYREVAPQVYSKQIQDLQLANAKLEVEAGLLRQQLMGLGVLPCTDGRELLKTALPG